MSKKRPLVRNVAHVDDDEVLKFRVSEAIEQLRKSGPLSDALRMALDSLVEDMKTFAGHEASKRFSDIIWESAEMHNK